MYASWRLPPDHINGVVGFPRLVGQKPAAVIMLCFRDTGWLGCRRSCKAAAFTLAVVVVSLALVTLSFAATLNSYVSSISCAMERIFFGGGGVT